MLFWPKFAPFGPKMGEGDFFQKSVSYTFEHFYIPNFMLFPGKVRYRQTDRCTDRHTHKSDLIGPFPVNRRPKKKEGRKALFPGEWLDWDKTLKFKVTE